MNALLVPRSLAPSLLLFVFLLLPACTPSSPDHDANLDGFTSWSVYLGDPTSSHYSRLDQINRENVDGLQVAWTYNTGDASPDGKTQIQCNPIIIDSVLYATSPEVKVFALHAATGEALWTFDPFATGVVEEAPSVNRGVSYWENEQGEEARILMTAGSRLFALDTRTGQPIPSFGQNGSIDLHEGLGRDVTGLSVQARTPGIVYKDLLIQGTTLSETPATAPGHIRAYDVRTGALAWIFHTIPHPGEYGYETWPEDAYLRIGGANTWTGLSLDVDRGIVFLPTGSAAFDFWGGNRAGDNLFANSVLALNAETGERLWHYQVVHHDIWDRDLPAAPNLVTVTHDGQRIDAVAQITKSGHVFLLDRETGVPLFPVEERPFPPSDLIDEEASPTQPIPTKPPPFARQRFEEEDITDRSPEAHAYILERFQQVRSGGPFVPASTQGTMIFPGFDGGGEWGGAGYDPTTGMLYVNANEMPWILEMVALNPEGASSGKGLYALYCAGCHGTNRQGNADLTYPSLQDVQTRLTAEELEQHIVRGKGFMPSFGFLSESEREALVNFLLDQETATEESGEQYQTERFTNFAGSPYGHTGYNRFLDQEGYPAVKPPWGTLNAINLNTGEIDWTVPLGEFPELTARGIPQTGTENYGGPVVTAGGLLFIAASKDEKFRAFDKETGAVLWETDLPAGGYATPATYAINGKQYVVIAAGGGKMGTKSGDAYVAFALPN